MAEALPRENGAVSDLEGGVRLPHSDGRNPFEPFGSSFHPNWRESGVQLTEKQAVLLMHDIYDDDDDVCSIVLFFSSLLIAANLNFYKGKFQIFDKFMDIRSFLMDNYAKICKLSKSNHPSLAVVLTRPVYNRIHYPGTCTLCAPLRMG